MYTQKPRKEDILNINLTADNDNGINRFEHNYEENSYFHHVV